MSQDALLEAFDREGFVRLRQLLTTGEVQETRRQLDRYIRDIVPTVAEGDRVLEADGQSLRNLWRMEKYDRFFHDLAYREDILQIVEQLVHGAPQLMGVETFNKPAKVGSGVPHHQDNAYFCKAPPDVLTVWIAIDPVTLENGPVYYVKGSHKLGMLPHKPSGVKGNSMVMTDPPRPDSDREFVGTLEPGDALMHHCQTIHYSAPNRSDASRCGLLMVYQAAHVKEDPQLLATYRGANS